MATGSWWDWLQFLFVYFGMLSCFDQNLLIQVTHKVDFHHKNYAIFTKILRNHSTNLILLLLILLAME